MAYLKSQEEDDENVPRGINGGTGGFFGSGMGASSTSKQFAPTSSGSRFVNLQRYLEQNPLGSSAQKISNKTNDILNSEGQSYAQQMQPVTDFLNTSGNDSIHQKKTDSGFGFLGQLGTNWEKLKTDPHAFDDLVNSRSGIAPNLPSWSFSAESKDKLDKLSNPELLTSQLSSDPSRYTPGMAALDQSLYSTGNETKNAIGKIPGQMSDWISAQNKKYSDTSNSLSKWKSDEDETAAATKAYLRQIYDEAKAAGEHEYDPSGLNQKRYQNLSSILGVPNDIKFKPIPYELTPEGKKEAEERKAAEKADKDYLEGERKLLLTHPGLANKLQEIEESQKKGPEVIEPRGGFGYGMNGPYSDAWDPLYGSEQSYYGSQLNGARWPNQPGYTGAYDNGAGSGWIKTPTMSGRNSLLGGTYKNLFKYL